MAKYYVSSGDLRTIVISNTPKEAILNVFENLQELPKYLDFVIIVSERGFEIEDKNAICFLTEYILEETNQLDNFKNKEWLE